MGGGGGGGILKGVSPINVYEGGCALTTYTIWGFSGHAIWWRQHVMGLFLCPSCSQKRENTAFELVLRSGWRLLSPSKEVARSSTPCRKSSLVWDIESEWWPRYLQQSRQCWKLEEF